MARKMKNKITSLVDCNGVEQFSEEVKGDIAVQYFQELFQTSHPQPATKLLEGFGQRVTGRMNRELIKTVTDGEIRRAVQAIKSDSAAGADGMSGAFFQKFWSITGPKVIEEVKGFFEAGNLPTDWNFTQLCLLPKKPNPNKMTDLRPISLCSVVYKIISKVMCTRLKRILPQLVSQTQGAFVAGRLISDNLLMAHEMIHGLRTNPSCKQDYIAIKTDMSKAYDKVEWSFLEELFLKMGFDQRWIGWVMTCVRSVSYTVLLNGQTHGHIMPSRGLRQGDPLSPFLFILCAEALVHIMNKAEIDGKITGIKLTKQCPSIQHLLFADDSLFLCKATLRECTSLLYCLKLYGDASGQEINFQKSSVTYEADIDQYMKTVIAALLNTEKEGGAGSYLGLPECFSGSKRQLLAFITNKLNKRISGWFVKSLSLGGKEILLKTIAMALPVYAMTCFRLTKHQCQKLMSAMAKFWWSACSDKQKIHWVSWQEMCKSKEFGGLGFRDIEGFNQALLAKQAWRILNDPNSLMAKLYKGRYFSNKDFLNSTKGYKPSYAWRSILHGRELLMKDLIKSVVNGDSTKVWIDKWIMDQAPRRAMSKHSLYDLDLKVSDLITSTGSWNMEILENLFPREEIKRIMTLTPGNVVDQNIWAYTKNGSYTVKSGYWLWMNQGSQWQNGVPHHRAEEIELKKRVWKIKTQPKIRTFLWRVLSGALAVSDRLRTRGLLIDNTCKLCGTAIETISHMLFQCSAATNILLAASIPLPAGGFTSSVTSNVRYMFNLMEDNNIPEHVRKSIPWCMWNVWKHRNAVLIASIQETSQVLAQRISDDTKEWCTINTSSETEEMRRLTSMRSTERWLPPVIGTIKCNLHANWGNANMLSGIAWIARDHRGWVQFHARDALTPSSSKLVAELRCVEWVLRSLRDLRFQDVVLVSDCRMAIEAISKPEDWPRFRVLLTSIRSLRNSFKSCAIEIETVICNLIVRDIAKSVTKDGRFRSYLAMGGPAWLHERLQREETRDIGESLS